MRIDPTVLSSGRINQPSVLSSARSARIEGPSRPGGDREPPLRTDDAGLDALQDKRLADACKDFEALFLSSVLKAMRKTVEKTNLLGSDSAEDTFQEMMDIETAKCAAKTSSMGIADMLYRQLRQEVTKND